MSSASEAQPLEQNNDFRKIAHSLWIEGGRLHTNLTASLALHPENWHKEGLEQRLREWDKVAERYFDAALSTPVQVEPKREEEAQRLLEGAKTFDFFGCLSCGYSGTITTEEIAKHRSRCAHGPTVAVQRQQPSAVEMPEPLVSDREMDDLTAPLHPSTAGHQAIKELRAWRRWAEAARKEGQ